MECGMRLAMMTSERVTRCDQHMAWMSNTDVSVTSPHLL